MKKATLGIITHGKKVLLGMKRGGSEIGDGTLNGPGGKLEPGESLIECLVRETREEVGIELDVDCLEKCAIITFHSGGVPDFEVHVYRTNVFKGEPRKTESMIPSWYDSERLPVNHMLESDRRWFQKLLNGERFCANVYYREHAKGFSGIGFLPFVDSD